MKSFLFFFALLSFCSCNQKVTHYTRIENNSVYKLKLKWLNDNLAMDSLILLPQKKATVLEYNSKGNANEFNNCPFQIGALQIETIDTNLIFVGSLQYDFAILKEKFTGAETECEAVIKTSMFQ